VIGRSRHGNLLSHVLGSPAGLLAGRAATVLIVLSAWELASGGVLPAAWMSSPSRIAAALASMILDGTLWFHLQATLLAVSLGYVLGSAAGIALGLGLGLMPKLDEVLRPFISGLWSLPKIALLPLFVIFLGLGIESKAALVASVVVFLVLYCTVDGVRDVDRDLIDSLVLMGATRREITMKVLLPAALPWIYTGMRVSISYALVTAVVGELLSSNRGLGFLMESAAARFDASQVFAGIVVLVVISLGLTALLTRLESSSLRWRR
jgi:NitT/TauT family transport system permease protein